MNPKPEDLRNTKKGMKRLCKDYYNKKLTDPEIEDG
jgi:hypothetical protein